jgi:hypothetical protein
MASAAGSGSGRSCVFTRIRYRGARDGELRWVMTFIRFDADTFAAA